MPLTPPLDAAPPDADRAPGTRADTFLKGTRWMAGGQFGVQLLRLSVQTLLARLLAPDDFGLLAMALVITNLLDIVKDLGTTAAVVQRRELSRGFLNGVFFLNIGLGLLIAAGLVVSATALGGVFAEPRLVPVLQVLAVATFISALGLLPQGLLTRQMRFRQLAGVQLVDAAGSAAIAVPLAALGYGVWSVVIGVIAGSTIGMATGWRLTRWMPSTRFRRSDLAGVWSFSINLSASEILFFLTSNLDKVIIGAALGPAPLGLYTIVQKLLLQTVRSLTGVPHRVLFSIFSDAQSDDAVLRRGFLRVSGGLAFITFPIVMGMASVAGPLVDTLLGPEWRDAVPLFVLLAPVAIVQTLGSTTGVLFKAKGRTDLQLYWAAVVGAVTALSFWVGVRWGITGVAAAYSVALVTLMVPALLIAFRLIGLRFRDFAEVVWPHAWATATMSAAVWGTLALLPFSSPSAKLACGVVIGAGVYIVIAYLQRPAALGDLTRFVLPRLRFRRDRGSTPPPGTVVNVADATATATCVATSAPLTRAIIGEEG